jgi:hypothetical protein
MKLFQSKIKCITDIYGCFLEQFKPVNVRYELYTHTNPPTSASVACEHFNLFSCCYNDFRLYVFHSTYSPKNSLTSFYLYKKKYFQV